MSDLGDKLIAVDDGLMAIPHAFGGAIALAYCTEEPRATIDLDVNVFVDAGDAADVFDALPGQVRIHRGAETNVGRDGQVRLWWDDTPLDLFFSYHPFHDHAASRTRTVPFEGRQIRVLDCTDLVVFKALFGRTKDWADIEAATATASVEPAEAMRWVADLAGPRSATALRLQDALRARTDDTVPRAPDVAVCGRWMPRARRRCARPRGHVGACR